MTYLCSFGVPACVTKRLPWLPLRLELVCKMAVLMYSTYRAAAHFQDTGTHFDQHQQNVFAEAYMDQTMHEADHDLTPSTSDSAATPEPLNAQPPTNHLIVDSGKGLCEMICRTYFPITLHITTARNQHINDECGRMRTPAAEQHRSQIPDLA